MKSKKRKGKEKLVIKFDSEARRLVNLIQTVLGNGAYNMRGLTHNYLCEDDKYELMQILTWGRKLKC